MPDMGFEIAQQWVCAAIPDEFEQEARKIRAERDLKFKNIYSEHASDERWVGDLAEFVFNSWLKSHGMANYKWFLEDPIGNPDFEFENRVRIDVKAVKRQGPLHSNYTAQTTKQHAFSDKIDQLFFMSYELPRKKMWLIGGIDIEGFRKKAKPYVEGEQVHRNYKVRPGHSILNIEFSALMSPEQWIRSVC